MVKPDQVTVASIGIELANTGQNKGKSMLYFDKSITYALSIGRMEGGIFRQDTCFINRDSDSVANLRFGGGSASTACGTEDYFPTSTLTGERTNNFSGFNKHILKLAAATPIDPPGPGEPDNGVRLNPQTTQDIEHIKIVIDKTIKRSHITIMVSSNNLVLHHLLTQFPEIAEILYPTVSVGTKGLTVANKMENFPPGCAEVGFKCNKVAALKPLSEEEAEAIKRAHNSKEWKLAIEELKLLSQNKNIPIDFLHLFRAWNAGLDIQVEDEKQLNDMAFKRAQEASLKAWSDEIKSAYEIGQDKAVKGINLPFVFNSLLANPMDGWKHGANLQGKIMGSILATRMMATSKPPQEPMLPN